MTNRFSKWLSVGLARSWTWARLPPRNSVTYYVAGWYAASIALLITCAVLVVLLGAQGMATNDLDDRLKSALVKESKVVSMLSFKEVTALGITGHRPDELIDSRWPSVDVWQLAASGAGERALRHVISSTTSFVPHVPEQMYAGTPTNPKEAKAFALQIGSTNWRAVHAVVETADREMVLLQVALPVQRIESMVLGLLKQTMMGLPALLVIAFAGGLLVANKALAPIRSIVETTRKINPGDSAARLKTQSGLSEVDSLSKVINLLLDRTDAALKKQARFATEAAHELRTPLAAQRTAGELALHKFNSVPTLREAVSDMLEEGEHMHKLIDNLLLLARADASLLPSANALVNPRELVKRCVQSMAPLAEMRQQTIRCQLKSGCRIEVDATTVRQALMNLVHNAIRHTPEGTEIEVGMLTQGEAVVMYVSDNGPGFSSFDEAQTIRRAPVAADSAAGSAYRKDIGLGMGLSIAQALVHAQGGVLSIRSIPNRGTTAKLAFKRAQVVRKPVA